MPATLKRPRIHGGQAEGLPLADFSVDINPFGCPESVRSTILSALDTIERYPDPRAHALREAFAAPHHLGAGSILPGNGSAELIGLIVQALRPARALIVVPTFTEYAWALEQAGATIHDALTQEADGFQWPDPRAAWIPPLDEIDLVFLCNPNNPTGVAIPRAQVLALAARCEATRTTLVVDEAFVEWTDAPEQISVASAVSDYEHLIVLRSLTKLFAVPGLRLGYLAAPPERVDLLRDHQPAWPLNALAIAVGQQLMKETAYADRSRRLVRQCVQTLSKALSHLPGLRPFPSSTNFIFCKLATPHLTSEELCAQLALQGCTVRNCDDFEGLAPGRFIRIGVRTPADNDRLVSALREILHHAG